MSDAKSPEATSPKKNQDSKESRPLMGNSKGEGTSGMGIPAGISNVNRDYRGREFKCSTSERWKGSDTVKGREKLPFFFGIKEERRGVI